MMNQVIATFVHDIFVRLQRIGHGLIYPYHHIQHSIFGWGVIIIYSVILISIICFILFLIKNWLFIYPSTILVAKSFYKTVIYLLAMVGAFFAILFIEHIPYTLIFQPIVGLFVCILMIYVFMFFLYAGCSLILPMLLLLGAAIAGYYYNFEFFAPIIPAHSQTLFGLLKPNEHAFDFWDINRYAYSMVIGFMLLMLCLWAINGVYHLLRTLIAPSQARQQQDALKAQLIEMGFTHQAAAALVKRFDSNTVLKAMEVDYEMIDQSTKQRVALIQSRCEKIQREAL